MLSFFSRVRSLLRTRDRGASAVEYALMVAGIAVVILAVVFLLGNAIKDSFDKTCGAIKGGNSSTTTCQTGTTT